MDTAFSKDQSWISWKSNSRYENVQTESPKMDFCGSPNKT